MLLAVSVGCATPGRQAPVPAPRTIAQIESGYRLLQLIVDVGVVDNASMNAASRVKVRGVACQADGEVAAVCEYDASRCLPPEADLDGDEWCRRKARFVRVDRPDDPFHVVMIAQGWTVDRPRPE
ncbi:hypothetical protein [Sphingosinicella sp. LY1275]|uniref:hypothetical protein n=1 Tax=Sphingosinicella sp. LY1275 TaxID=3095379 RepID=UPI002ADEE594|nr:hypothetical protein [Sphingosinicella sp. LY1275]MEA1015193.1 hypothetical protein [Sphingosinicella sp. LY1275]